MGTRSGKDLAEAAGPAWPEGWMGAEKRMVTPHKHLRDYSEEKKSDQVETWTPESDRQGML